MSAIIGTHLIDIWQGPPPPQIKSRVATIARPGQATAAAKILPNQSHESQFTAVQFTTAGAVGPFASAHEYMDALRTLIGSTLALTFAGKNYGNVLIKDVTPLEIRSIVRAAGVHPDATAYNYSPAYRLVSGWTIVRLV